MAEGAVLVITSNRHPSQLTNQGLHEVGGLTCFRIAVVVRLICTPSTLLQQQRNDDL